MTKWFIGDLHFRHERVAALRGFATVAEHDAAIIHDWRARVGANDIVYVLGDLSRGGADEVYALAVLSDLPGRKRLVPGNHDSIGGIHRRRSSITTAYRAVFEAIHDYARIRVDGADVLLSHYPYASQGDGPGRGEPRYLEYRLPDVGRLLIHAHTHHNHPTSGSTTGRELCVSWDAWRRMVSAADVEKWVAAVRADSDRPASALADARAALDERIASALDSMPESSQRRALSGESGFHVQVPLAALITVLNHTKGQP